MTTLQARPASRPAPRPAASVREYARRAGATVRFVARTYRTLDAMKARRLGPGEAGAALARDVADMGPLYVKMAQFVASRRDAGLDPAFLDALSDVVLDSVPSPPSDPPSLRGYPGLRGYRVRPAPIASASIADVYLAEGPRGRRVAVKRRRPGVRASVETDLPLLHATMRACAAAGLPGAANMAEMIAESRAVLLGELDFTREGAVAGEFAAALAGAAPWLVVPRVLAASEDTLVTEYVPSRGLGEVVTPNPALAQRLMGLYMRMLAAGYVHADPHPGNLGFLADGRIVLYDFGAVLRVEPGAQHKVARALAAALAKDADALLESLEDLGAVDEIPDRAAARRLLRRVLRGGAGVHAELASAPEFASSARRIVRLRTEVIYLTRTLTLVDGACRRLDPGFAYDYAAWVDRGAVLAHAARGAMGVPGTLQAMQADLASFQGRVADEVGALKRLAVLAALAAACLAARGGV